ncbi:NAD(P)H-dependent flavin oxidoreductase [Nocardioides cheoyonin]|uniref:NAD(P)H-dependent flavin oxidoreductase n=1 Tax=Nocardioides cheoyonin TaxID=3156615 RepID=UPI0032B38A95
MANLFGTDLPIVAAPMAGGATTTALVEAVTRAGGFAFLPAGYKSPDDVRKQMAELGAAGLVFGVNLFVPDDDPVDPDAFAAYAEELRPEAEALGVVLPAEPVTDDDHWSEKVDLLVSEPAAYVSFTFGLPSAREVAALRRAGSTLLATVTTVEEAYAAKELGLDGLVAQGTDAGGHSGTHDPRRKLVPTDTGELVRAVAETGLPIVAAGGVQDSVTVTSLLHAGADTVAVGTMLLRTEESGASSTHKAALADPRFTSTTITHAFTGRPARGLLNGFIERHEETAPYGYPAIHHLTRALRAEAASAGDPERLHLWAGTGYRSAPTGPAADVVRHLGSLL